MVYVNNGMFPFSFLYFLQDMYALWVIVLIIYRMANAVFSHIDTKMKHTHTHTYDINVEVIHREKKSSSRKAGSGKGRMGKHKRKNMVKNISYTYMKV